MADPQRGWPPAAVALLREGVFDPTAFRVDHPFGEDGFGFWWSDEMLPEAVGSLQEWADWSWVEHLLGYRAGLCLGAPEEAWRAAWDQLREACPGWPGFHPSRCSPDLAAGVRRAAASPGEWSFNFRPVTGRQHPVRSGPDLLGRLTLTDFAYPFLFGRLTPGPGPAKYQALFEEELSVRDEDPSQATSDAWLDVLERINDLDIHVGDPPRPALDFKLKDGRQQVEFRWYF